MGHVMLHRHPVVHKLLLATEVEEIRKRILCDTEQSYTDHRGTWLAVPLAVKKYPHARRSLLYMHKNKPWRTTRR